MAKLNDFKKVKYICEIYKGKRFYFRQEYLLEVLQWGEPRRITEETFLRRKNDGFPVEYRRIEHLPQCIIREMEDINTLIDMALDTRDETWFKELLEQRNELLS